MSIVTGRQTRVSLSVTSVFYDVDTGILCGFEEFGEPGKKTSEETANIQLPDYNVKEVSDRHWLV